MTDAWTPPVDYPVDHIVTAAEWKATVAGNLRYLGEDDGIGTSLPASPAIGQAYWYRAEAIYGTLWSLRYDPVAMTGTTTATSTTISSIADTSGLFPGMGISGTGIPAGATVATIASGTSITISAAATASGAVTLTFTRWLASGPPLHHAVEADQQAGSQDAWVDLTTVGPTITVPLAGLYAMEAGVTSGPFGGSGYNRAGISIGGAAPGPELPRQTSLGGSPAPLRTRSRRFGPQRCTASSTVKLQYLSAGSTAGKWQERWLAVWPVAVI